MRIWKDLQDILLCEKKARHRAVWIVCHVLCKSGRKLRIYILANWYIHKKKAESIKQGSWWLLVVTCVCGKEDKR